VTCFFFFFFFFSSLSGLGPATGLCGFTFLFEIRIVVNATLNGTSAVCYFVLMITFIFIP
jgi:hypothetical protein